MRRTSLPARALALGIAVALAAAAAAAAEPLASFVWFPTVPHPGEAVSLVSTSTDAASPITTLAWDLTGDGPFAEGPVVQSTTFATPGPHVVRLRVTSADGQSSVAVQTIEVTPPPPQEMLPPPIVRMTGTPQRHGARIKLLAVEAPPGAQILVECRGRACPVRSEARAIAADTIGSVTVAFPAFQRNLRGGTVLVVRVTKSGDYGKYTSFLIRSRRPPQRFDECLLPAAALPSPCPA